MDEKTKYIEIMKKELKKIKYEMQLCKEEYDSQISSENKTELLERIKMTKNILLWKYLIIRSMLFRYKIAGSGKPEYGAEYIFANENMAIYQLSSEDKERIRSLISDYKTTPNAGNMLCNFSIIDFPKDIIDVIKKSGTIDFEKGIIVKPEELGAILDGEYEVFESKANRFLKSHDDIKDSILRRMFIEGVPRNAINIIDKTTPINEALLEFLSMDQKIIEQCVVDEFMTKIAKQEKLTKKIIKTKRTIGEIKELDKQIRELEKSIISKIKSIYFDKTKENRDVNAISVSAYNVYMLGYYETKKIIGETREKILSVIEKFSNDCSLYFDIKRKCREKTKIELSRFLEEKGICPSDQFISWLLENYDKINYLRLIGELSVENFTSRISDEPEDEVVYNKKAIPKTI